MIPSQTKFHDVQQNSQEWFDLRAGKITSSNFGTVCANMGKGFGDPAKRYAMKLAIERITGMPLDEGYSNVYMDRGHELEPMARHLYEEETFETVNNGGFFSNGNIGCSPDGMVRDGMIEIKSVVYNTQFERLIKGGYDTKYKWQIEGNMLITGAAWCDFVSYCPELPENKQLYVYRVEPDPDRIKALLERLEEFEQLINDYSQILLK